MKYVSNKLNIWPSSVIEKNKQQSFLISHSDFSNPLSELSYTEQITEIFPLAVSLKTTAVFCMAPGETGYKDHKNEAIAKIWSCLNTLRTAAGLIWQEPQSSNWQRPSTWLGHLKTFRPL